jgi:hypothetical protein
MPLDSGPSNIHRPNLIRKALLLLLLLPLLLLVDLLLNGFTTGPACGFGFGKRHKAVQEKEIRSFFKETLPNQITVDSITCSGFTDLTLMATFHISNEEAKPLLSDLEATFLGPEQYTQMGRNFAKHRRQIGRPTENTFIYELSGFPQFDTRKVSITIPKGDEKIATVVFEGGKH